MNIELLMIWMFQPEMHSSYSCADVPDELLPGSSLPGRHPDGPAQPPAGDRLEPHQSGLLGRPGGLQGCQVPTGCVSNYF